MERSSTFGVHLYDTLMYVSIQLQLTFYLVSCIDFRASTEQLLQLKGDGE